MRHRLGRAARELLTDYDNATFDSGRVIACFASLGMLALAAYDVIVNHQRFDAQALGVGIAAVAGGLGVYLMGDNKRPPVTPPAPPGSTQINIER